MEIKELLSEVIDLYGQARLGERCCLTKEEIEETSKQIKEEIKDTLIEILYEMK